jgi:hypothetical protein
MRAVTSPMRAPCEPHASPMRAPCEPHASPMRAPCEPHASPMRAPCEPHASPMRAPCEPDATSPVCEPLSCASSSVCHLGMGDVHRTAALIMCWILCVGIAFDLKVWPGGGIIASVLLVLAICFRRLHRLDHYVWPDWMIQRVSDWHVNATIVADSTSIPCPWGCGAWVQNLASEIEWHITDCESSVMAHRACPICACAVEGALLDEHVRSCAHSLNTRGTHIRTRSTSSSQLIECFLCDGILF